MKSSRCWMLDSRKRQKVKNVVDPFDYAQDKFLLVFGGFFHIFSFFNQYLFIQKRLINSKTECVRANEPAGHLQETMDSPNVLRKFSKMRK